MQNYEDAKDVGKAKVNQILHEHKLGEFVAKLTSGLNFE